ncbi:MAG: Ig-like domain-containing protein, partial [Treponemataceae bacterium]|nr:Ig-like domain-containing protein [Treponemataceae bacterium]
MKKQTWLAACMAAACAFALVIGRSSETESGAVERVTLNATTLTLSPGATGKLTATVLPENADDKTVTWSSSDTEVATVGEDGTVTAVKAGEATITARAGGKTAVCEVTVKPILIAVERVTLNATTLTLSPGATGKLTATVLPENADDKTVTWSSSDTEVATVGEDGTVTAVKAGEATITARAGGKTAVCEVTVKPILIAVESVTLNETTLTLMRGETGNLTATVLPENADDRTVMWSSSDTAVATVDENGTVAAVGIGTATIYAQAGNKQAACRVTVRLLDAEAEGFEINVNGTLTKYTGTDTDVKIPDGVREIGYSAFKGHTSLTGVTIPKGVTSIGLEAFRDCDKLASVTIPASVTSIGINAFW